MAAGSNIQLFVEINVILYEFLNAKRKKIQIGLNFFHPGYEFGSEHPLEHFEYKFQMLVKNSRIRAFVHLHKLCLMLQNIAFIDFTKDIVESRILHIPKFRHNFNSIVLFFSGAVIKCHAGVAIEHIPIL